MENEETKDIVQSSIQHPDLHIQDQSRSLEPPPSIIESQTPENSNHKQQKQFGGMARAKYSGSVSYPASSQKEDKTSIEQNTMYKSVDRKKKLIGNMENPGSGVNIRMVDSNFDTGRKMVDNSSLMTISPRPFDSYGYQSRQLLEGKTWSQENLLQIPGSVQTVDQDNSNANANVSAQSTNSEAELRLAKKFNAVYQTQDKVHMFSLKSLYCLGPENKLRTACVHIMVNKWFDRFITFCIVANSILLASKEYEEKYDASYESSWNSVLDKIDLVFTIIFLFECLVKVIAMGFVVHKRSYLRDRWNWIDFFIVLVSLVAFTPGIDPKSLKVFRTARILRPLRSMSQLKSMRLVIQTFINSIPGLFNVCIFQAFIFTIFAIISINFFVGEQYQFCRTQPDLIDDGVNPLYWPKNEDASWQCSSNAMCTGFPNNLGEDSGAVCGDIYRDFGLDPTEYDQVRENELINYDITNFNSVLNAALTIFQVITLEGWSQLMYNYQDTVSYTTSSIFFVLVVILGAFTTLNMILAAIMHSYLKQEEKRKKEEAEEKLKTKSRQEATSVLISEATAKTVATSAAQSNRTDLKPSVEIARREHLSVIEELELANADSVHMNTFGNAAGEQMLDSQAQKSPSHSQMMSYEVNGGSAMRAEGQASVLEQNSKEVSPIQYLPQVHGQTMTRFRGIQAHQELENKVKIDQTLLASQSSHGGERIDRGGAESYEILDVRDMMQDQNSERSSPPQIRHSPSNSSNIQFNNITPMEQPFESVNAQTEKDDIEININKVEIVAQREKENIINDEKDMEQSQRTEAEIHAEHRAKRNCVYGFFYEVVTSVTFNFLIYLFILGNTITLSLYRYDQSDSQTDILKVCDIIFVWVFTAEMLAKFVGLGIKNYMRDKFNIFDSIIVVISLIDFAMMMSIEVDESTDGIMSALRALRLLRVVKLARHWKAFQEILITMVQSLADISNFTVLLLLIIYILALLGMEIFSYSVVFDIDGNPVFGEENIKAFFESGQEMVWPRDNFNNIFSSMVTCFIVIIAEDWNQTMYLYVRAADVSGSRSLALAYFIGMFIIGNTIMLALFTALLLRAQDDDLQKLEEQIDQKAQKSISTRFSQIDVDKQGQCDALKRKCSRKNCAKKCTSFADSFVKVFGGESAYMKRLEARKQKDPRSSASPISGNAIAPTLSSKNTNSQRQNDLLDINIFESNDQELNSDTAKKQKTNINKIQSFVLMDAQGIDDKNSKPLQRPVALLHYDYDQVKIVKKRSLKTNKEKVLYGRSLYIFSDENPLRKLCNRLTSYWVFDAVIILLIIVSTATLAFEHPLEDPNSEKMQILEKIDIAMTVVFSLEAVLKIITAGFLINGKKSYLLDTWNMLDFIIVVLSIVSLNITADISFVKVLRVARILRPLRLIQHAESLKIAIQALFKSIPQIMRLQVVVLFMIFMISILLTSLLSGKLHRCNLDHTGLSYAQQQRFVRTKWDCLNYGGIWVSPEMNFDDTLRGMLTLFIFQSREGWTGLMWDSVDAKAVDEVPVVNNNVFFIVFYIVLVIILCLLFVNMFVRIVIQTYNLEKDFLSFNRLLEDEQRSWIKVQIMTYGFEPQPLLVGGIGINCLRRVCIKISQSVWFDNFIMGCIMLNTIVMALVWFDEPEELPSVIEILNYVFAGIFTLEAIIKLIAMKRMYFRDSWNIFDFTIVVFTLVILTLKVLQIDVQFGSGATILRALRIGRILRLIKQAQKLQIIFHTLLDSAQSLASLGLLLVILFFMFAIIGRSFFGMVRIGEPNLELNEHANFRDFSTSFLLLMRCSTGESWHLIMFDLARSYDATYQCREDEDYESMMANGGEPFACGSPVVSYIFFVLFHILVTQVFINLFVAIIIDAFLEQTDHFQLPIKNYEIQAFVDVWQKFDPDATGYILIKDLNRFMLELSRSTWGCTLIDDHKKIQESFIERKRFVAQLGIPTYDQLKKVMFYDTLQQLCYLKNLRLFNMTDEYKKKKKVLEQFGKKMNDEESFNALKENGSNIQLDFEKILRKMGRLNPKIKLILQLQDKFKEVHDKYARFADTENNIGLSEQQRKNMEVVELNEINQQNKLAIDDVNLLSTKHYFYGHLIMKVWKRKKIKKLRSLAIQSSDGNNTERDSTGQRKPQMTPNGEGKAMVIEQNSLKNTQTPFSRDNSQRQSRVDSIGKQSSASSQSPTQRNLIQKRISSKVAPLLNVGTNDEQDHQNEEVSQILDEEMKNLNIESPRNVSKGAYQSEVALQQQEDHAIVEQEVFERSMNAASNYDQQPGTRPSMESGQGTARKQD